MYVIPYSSKTYRVDDRLIAGNSTSDTPVEFELFPVDGEDRARLMMLVQYPLIVQQLQKTATPEGMAQASLAMAEGPKMFARAVGAIRNFYVRGEHAVRSGILTVEKDAPVPETVAVTTGAQFAEVAAFMPPLCSDLAIEIFQLQNKAKPDARFTQPRSGSGGPESAAPTTSAAKPARKPRGGKGTAASSTPTGNAGDGSSPSSK